MTGADRTAGLPEHRPVYLPREDYPGEIGQVGCACGHRPKRPALTMSGMDASYRTHARRLPGAELDLSQTRYLSGSFAGMTWAERYAAEEPEKAAAHAARLRALAAAR